MAKTLKCTARRMAGGQGHEHISHIWYIEWETDSSGNGWAVSAEQVATREQMVAHIKQPGSLPVWCADQNGGKSAWVHVNNNGYIEYVQTYADNRYTNNLLSLPLK